MGAVDGPTHHDLFTPSARGEDQGGMAGSLWGLSKVLLLHPRRKWVVSL